MAEIVLREAGLNDVAHILRHRRDMFWEIGDHDEDAHRRMLLSTASFLREAIPRGVYRGWLAQTGEGRVVAGAGVAIVPWPGSPEDPAGRRGWIQNVYTEPAFRHRGLARRLMQSAIDWCREAGFVHIPSCERGGPSYTKAWAFSRPMKCGCA